MKLKVAKLKDNRGFVAVTDTMWRSPVIRTFSTNQKDVQDFIDKGKVYDKALDDMKKAQNKLKSLPQNVIDYIIR